MRQAWTRVATEVAVDQDEEQDGTTDATANGRETKVDDLAYDSVVPAASAVGLRLGEADIAKNDRDSIASDRFLRFARREERANAENDGAP